MAFEFTTGLRRTVRALGAAALTVSAIACRPAGPESTRIVTRLITDGDHPSSNAAVTYDTVEVARWEFNDPQVLAEWTPERIDTTFEITEDGLAVETTSNDPSIYRDVELRADRIDAVRVTQSGLTSDAYMQLYWAGNGESFSDDRTLGCATKDMTGALIASYTFRVQDHPQWRDDIRMLRLDPTSVPNRRQLVHLVSALDFVPSPERIAAVAARPWRLDIQGDVRTAMLAIPSHPIVRDVKVLKKAALRFAQALEPGMTVPVTFRIFIRNRGSEDRLVHERTLDPCTMSEGCSWVEGTIDLAEFAGRTIQLRFETEAAEPLDLFDGFPAWAGLEVVQTTSKKKPPNVVLIVLDTLRADRLSLSGYPRRTSPNLDAWAAKRGVIFDTVVAPAPWTLPSHVSIFTGLDALSHGVNTGDPMPSSLQTMAELLRAEGYTTHAVTGGAYLSDAYGVMQGFDSYHYYYRPLLDPSESGNDLVGGVDRAVFWLDSTTDRPFFLFFHTYEIHTPYRAREPYFSEFYDRRPDDPIPPVDTLPLEPVRERGYLMTAALQARLGDPESPYQRVPDERFPMVDALYDSGVAFADLHVKRILDRLDDLDLNRNTVVVVTSDHGESLGERGQADHKSLEDWELLVPLIISAPEIIPPAGRRVSTQVRLIDVLPTVLELVGVGPAAGIDGRSLTGLIDDPSLNHPEEAWSYASSSNFGLGLRRGGLVKYTFNNSAWLPIHGQETLYRLNVDPATETNVAATDPETPRFRAHTCDTFDRRTSGVRVRFSNRLDVPMEGHLKGQIVEPLRVKAFRLPTGDIEWRYQMVNFSVPAGQSLVFHIEGNPFGELYVTSRFDIQSNANTGFKMVLRLETMADPWQAVFDGQRWEEDSSADLDQISGVEVWIHGDRAGAGAPPEIDEQSRELLKKLGYIR